MNDTQINLIQRKSGAFGKLTNIEETLRRVTWIFLLILFVVGVSVSVAYLFTRTNIGRLETRKTRVTRDINAQSVKEGVLLSLKERTAIAARALDAAKPWGKLFTVLREVAREDAFLSIAVEETGRVTASLELVSVDEAVTVVANTIFLFEQRALRSPQMLSFAIRETGQVQITMSFHPVF